MFTIIFQGIVTMLTNFFFFLSFFLTKCSLTLLILDMVLYSFLASVTKPLTPEGTKKIRRKGFLQKLEYLVNMTQWHVIWVHFVSKMITNVRCLVLLFTATFSLLHESDAIYGFLSLKKILCSPRRAKLLTGQCISTDLLVCYNNIAYKEGSTIFYVVITNRCVLW